MKICLIVPHFPPHVGGGEQLYLDMAKGLTERGHQVRVVTSASGGVAGEQSYEGVAVRYCPWRMVFGHPLPRISDLMPAARWADAVHTAVYTTAPAARRAAKRAGKPVFLLIHEVIGNRWNMFEPNKLKALAFRTAEYFVCRQKYDGYHVVSESTKRDFLHFIGNRENLYRIYNSVHAPELSSAASQSITLQDYFGLRPGDRSFLYFGRPAPNKGVFVLEQAIALLQQRKHIPDNIRFCFLLADEPKAQREKFLQTAAKSGLESLISVRPSVSRGELFKLIRDADTIIIPSVTEGFGFSAAEACSLGKPVLHSTGGSLPEVVWGRTLSFENRNSADLADKLECIFKQGNDAFSVVPDKRFDRDMMLDELERFYFRLVGEREAP